MFQRNRIHYSKELKTRQKLDAKSIDLYFIISQGRNGKGSIYVWASGDGGPTDDCNCDGYASSMWTISINSAINDGRTALYDESCSSTLASTFSNGRNRHPEAGVVGVFLLFTLSFYTFLFILPLLLLCLFCVET